jgi:hypothetical protein
VLRPPNVGESETEWTGGKGSADDKKAYHEMLGYAFIIVATFLVASAGLIYVLYIQDIAYWIQGTFPGLTDTLSQIGRTPPGQ